MKQRYQDTFHALGSDAILTIVADTPPQQVFDELRQVIHEFEQRFSRFLDASELTMFNLQAGKKTLISPEFHDLLVTAKTMSLETHGIFNPFVLPKLQEVGYKGSWPHPDNVSEHTNFEKRSLTDARQLIVDDTWAKVPRDSALDFGGIGKGYLLDRLGDILEKRQVHSYWLSLGGDLVSAGYDIDGRPWAISVEGAIDNSGNVATMPAPSGARLAVATSGVVRRKGIHDGKAWHHLIDPRTGLPAETDVLSATVSASTATIADIYAKVVVLVGSSRAQEACRGNIEVKSGFLQLSNGKSIQW